MAEIEGRRVNGKLCRRCREDKPDVYAGKYPRHTCLDCQIATCEENRVRRQKHGVNPSRRARIMVEVGGRCEACGQLCRNKVDRYDRGDDIGEVDHILPVILGGTNDRANLRLLCKRCNRAKGARRVA